MFNQKLDNKEMMNLWHHRLGHPGVGMMRKIIENSIGRPMKKMRISQPNELSCFTCSQGKLIIRPSLNKITTEISKFLERIHGDIICGPINLLLGHLDILCY